MNGPHDFDAISLHPIHAFNEIVNPLLRNILTLGLADDAAEPMQVEDGLALPSQAGQFVQIIGSD